MLYVVTACHSELGETMEASMLGEVRAATAGSNPCSTKDAVMGGSSTGVYRSTVLHNPDLLSMLRCPSY